MAPQAMDRATKAATDSEQERTQECSLCGWPFGPGLTLTIVECVPQLVCDDPWRCWDRRQQLREHREQYGQGTEGL